MTKRLTAYLTNSIELVSRYDIEEGWMCRKITNSEFELFSIAIQDNDNLWGELSGTLFDTCKVVEEQKKQRDLKRKGVHGNRIHADGCSGKMKIRWSGMSCDCGARWVCL